MYCVCEVYVYNLPVCVCSSVCYTSGYRESHRDVPTASKYMLLKSDGYSLP